MNPESIQIVENNTYFLLICKPAGLSVHNQSPSVADWLQAQELPRHFVNRLDQETSGLMLIAKKPELHGELAEALDHGKKIYRALLRSPWKSSESELVWESPISDKAEGRLNPQGKAADRVAAGTAVKIVRTNQYFTEVTAELLTGRQHQIRKHAAIAKHPIVGDKRYNEEKYNKNIEKFYGNKRMLLHAERLHFSFRGTDYEFFNSFDLSSFFP